MKKKSSMVFACAAAASLFLGGTAFAETFTDMRHVAPHGSNENPGTEQAPWKSIQHALNKAGPGAVVRLAPGVFNERIAFKTSGKEGAPVILEGTVAEDGKRLTRIEGGDKVDPKTWEPAPDIGPDVYQNSRVDYEPQLVTVDGKFLGFAKTRAHMLGGIKYDWKTFLTMPENEMTHARGVTQPIPFWETMGGVYACHPDPGNNTTYIRLPGGTHPGERLITFTPDEAVITIHGKLEHIVVRNLDVSHGDRGILVTGGEKDASRTGFFYRRGTPEDAPRHILIDNCHVTHGRTRIEIIESASNVTVRNCLVTPGFAGHPTGTWMLGGRSKNAETYARHAYFYHFFKFSHGPEGWTNDRGIVVRSDASHVLIEDNILDSGGVGIMSQEAKLTVRRNTIRNFSSIGIAPFLGTEAEFYDNLLENNSINMRLHRIVESDYPQYRVGIYRNRMNLPMDAGMHIVTFGTPGKDHPDPKVVLYHNTFSGGKAGFSFAPQILNMPEFLMVNNVFDAELNLRGNRLPKMNVATFDYNWLGGTVARAPFPEWLGKHNILADGRRIWSEPEHNILPEDHPARNAGIDVSRPFTIDGTTHDPLPGMEPNYFHGEKPDMGAVQHAPQPRPIASPADSQ